MKILNVLSKFYLVIPPIGLLLLLAVVGLDQVSTLGLRMYAYIGYGFVGAPIVTALLLFTTESITSRIKVWKYVCGVTMAVLTILIGSMFLTDNQRVATEFPLPWGQPLFFLPSIITLVIGIPLFYISFIALVVEENF